MELGIYGLGRMGMNMMRRLRRLGDHHIIASNRSPGKRPEVEAEGAIWADDLADLARKLTSPRAAWIMIPAGAPVDDAIAQLLTVMEPGDTIIDGGNSYYKDSRRRGTELAEKGIHFLDSGTSGGIWGLEVGYCLMIGGPQEAFDRLVPIFTTLAPPEGFLRCGDSGAGHYVKMIHNGVEYGMMQAYAEGFELMEASEYGLDLERIAHLWGRGSVVRSWLLELAEDALRNDPGLASIKGFVEDSGEGQWTVQDGFDKKIPTHVIAAALYARYRSRQDDSFAMKVVAALRNEFGGHAVKKE